MTWGTHFSAVLSIMTTKGVLGCIQDTHYTAGLSRDPVIIDCTHVAYSDIPLNIDACDSEAVPEHG